MKRFVTASSPGELLKVLEARNSIEHRLALMPHGITQPPRVVASSIDDFVSSSAV